MVSINMMQIIINNLLRADAYLMVNILILQLSQGLLGCHTTLFIIFYGIDNIIIGHTSLNHIVLVGHDASATTIYNILKPLHIVTFKTFDTAIFKGGFIKLKYANRGISHRTSTYANHTCPLLSLSLEHGEIEA